MILFRFGARRSIAGLSAVAFLLILSTTAHAANWTVIFRGSDPTIYNTQAGASDDADGYATLLNDAPQTIRYLRFKRMDTGDAVIIDMNSATLGRVTGMGSEIMWVGGTNIRHKGTDKSRGLGVGRKSWLTDDPRDEIICHIPGNLNKGYKGWGFGKVAANDNTQTYSWAGASISKTVFEIAVTNDDLSADEKALYLPKNASGEAPSSPDQPQNPGDDSPRVPAPTQTAGGASLLVASDTGTAITKQQTSIEALYVVQKETGDLLGLGSRFILTATPGQYGRNSVPVTFVSPVGPQMHMVLDDVVRAMNVHYSVTGVSKLELSFEDRYTAKDGGSAGAAIGTLMLSLIHGFDIDPKLAITGDVTADALVRKIGGVAAKLRGAREAQCAIVVLPADNFEQVQDAMVYDGPHSLADIQVIGVSDLDGAAAVARADRADSLAKAIDLFSKFQASLKDSPAYLFTADGKPDLTESSATIALQKLTKVRPISDMTIRPLIDAWIDYIRACSSVLRGSESASYAEQKRQAVLDALTRINADHDLAEKMLQEGI